ncbi:MAG: hypothetical protein GX349_07685 [Firmicutes bacterium]|nr:hypothetical protein [Bacillota bacterium]
MKKEIGPAKLPYAIDTDQHPTPPAGEKTPSQNEGVKPAALRYAAEDEGMGPTGEKKTPYRSVLVGAHRAAPKSKAQGKPPRSAYRIPSMGRTRRGGELMAKRVVTLKVEDLLRAGRSHFEIPKSQQRVSVIKSRPRRG